MAKTEINYEQERLLLEERKIKALEKLASAVDLSYFMVLKKSKKANGMKEHNGI